MYKKFCVSFIDQKNEEVEEQQVDSDATDCDEYGSKDVVLTNEEKQEKEEEEEEWKLVVQTAHTTIKVSVDIRDY